MGRIKLNECFRICVEDGKMSLQVLNLKFEAEGTTGQGHYIDMWEDVPIVFKCKCGCELTKGHCTGHCDNDE